MQDLKQLATSHFSALSANSYPGRGIIIGMSPDQEHMVQIYWIMGRSENSRNRVFLEEDNGFVRTKAFDESKLEDPSLIIYYPARVLGKKYIITNGDQTDTIYDYLRDNKSAAEALFTREYEPDGPNFTPRISGLVDLENDKVAYELSILKSFHNTESSCLRQFFTYEKALPGYGHFISTYEGDGNPLPSFSGEPQLMEIKNTVKENLNHYWDNIDADNKVSLVVKFINIKTGEQELKITNKLA